MLWRFVQIPRVALLPFPARYEIWFFSSIASAARLQIDYHDNYHLHPDVIDHDDWAECIELLHEWAPRSYIAQGACEVLWSSGKFNHGWYSGSDNIVDPRATLFLSSIHGKTLLRKSVGTPIDLRKCVQEIRLNTNPNPHDLANPSQCDAESLLKLKKELLQLYQFPRLRRVQLEIWIPQQCDAYLEGMIVVESISAACNELRKRIGAGLNVVLIRAWPYDIEKFEFLEDYDVSWMWDQPIQAHREHVLKSLSTVDEKIRVLIADGVDPDGEGSLLEELRKAGSFVPQCKDDILRMEVWGPWTGIGETERKSIKESWGRDDEDL